MTKQPSEPNKEPRAKSIFLRIVGEDASEQDRILEEECGNDDALREEVLSLVRHAQLAPPSFLDPPPGSVAAADLARDAALPSLSDGTRIGDYRIDRFLGEGGMGMVYEAEHVATSRRVAIKVIKPGMDTRAVIQRFHYERQTLAALMHPNIAYVLDAGAMNSGLPYFVMELVHGCPITEHCHERKYEVRERIALLIQVARGMRHAHSRGVIHRDLKASNVLAFDGDDGPGAKIIDFGIALCLCSPTSSGWTADGRLLGTPEFMSPEQIGGSGAVDVRSDIYSLGVLAYLLLTDRYPIHPDRLRGLGPKEMVQVIEEATILPPSESVAYPTQAKAIRNDLDWVLLKALDRDPERRYSTAAEFEADLERWMKQQPVSAGPETIVHRVRKTVRRHRLLFGCLTAIFAVTAAALVIVTTLLVENREARQAESDARTEAEAVNRFVQEELLAAAAPEALGLTAPVQRVLHDAIRRFDAIFAGRPRVELGVRRMLATTLLNCRRPDLAIMHWDRAKSLAQATLQGDGAQTLHINAELGRTLTELGRLEEARSLLEYTLRRAEDKQPDSRELILSVRSRLGRALALLEDERGVSMLQAVVTSHREQPPSHVTEALLGQAWFAEVLIGAGRVAEGLRAWENLEERAIQALGIDHPTTLASAHQYGLALVDADLFREAIPSLRKVLEARATALGNDHPNTQAARELLLRTQASAGDPAVEDK